MTKQFIETDGFKTKYFSDAAKTVLHREDGPAINVADGYKAWYINGERHCEDGPAIESPCGRKVWYVNGKLHREGAPAVERANGIKEWWVDGKYQFSEGTPV